MHKGIGLPHVQSNKRTHGISYGTIQTWGNTQQVQAKNSDHFHKNKINRMKKQLPVRVQALPEIYTRPEMSQYSVRVCRVLVALFIVTGPVVHQSFIDPRSASGVTQFHHPFHSTVCSSAVSTTPRLFNPRTTTEGRAGMYFVVSIPPTQCYAAPHSSFIF